MTKRGSWRPSAEWKIGSIIILMDIFWRIISEGVRDMHCGKSKGLSLTLEFSEYAY